MPNLNDTRSELEQAFIAGWGTTTPINYDNTPYRGEVGEAYVRVDVEFVLSENVNIGAALVGMTKQRHSGFVKLTIYTPINKGSGEAYSLADTYKGIMDNKEVVSNLFTSTSDVRRSGEQVDGYYSIICFTDFTSDEQ